MNTSTTTEPPEATCLRNGCVDQLKADGVIVSPFVEKVMRQVPRHAFAPDTSLDDAYSPYAAVITKTGENGVQLSSVSAPQIQAMMMEQAGIKAGDRVLEIGSGGLNAAYLAELVGQEGNVTSVDIDPEVTGRARRLLDAHGYTRVRVVTADASQPIPGLGEVDVIMVTVGAWDIPPAWVDQLSPNGRLVVPLRMRGLTRSVAFQRVTDSHGGHLESTSALVCGFVAMQGSDQHDETQVLVNGTPEIALRFDDGAPADPHLLDNAVRTPRVEQWTGVTVALGEPFSGLQMHLAIDLPGFCVMSVDPQLDTGIVSPRHKGFSAAAVDGGTFAYVTTRRTPDDERAEFGVHALGPDASTFANTVAGSVRAWDREHRGGSDPLIRVHPAGTPDEAVPGDRVIEKRHSRISLSWPPA
ncbi:putative O-methyltransferase [Actinacidiphila reveromycinica]|uniref:Protein-L-isoaspartate O-methyltransferase n=1 Tax=Actinacidiphila reveromycinica TaxID=659352 RepID=A0A7U3UUL5_9ACTN|nr:methyltransferase, FxLD system [Streptomyces sp. SN-593]BBA99053.1 putative O-methyltransferase [Streptomyces sp. SN-593]